jgi:tetratricopeptide (TPR) repeat protein
MPKKQLMALLNRLRDRQLWRRVWHGLLAGLRWPWRELEKLAAFLGHAWKVLFMLVLLILSGLSGRLLWDECHKTVAVIGRIEAPEDLQKKGYTPQVLGNHLADALLKIDHESGTLMPHQHAISDFQQADVTLVDGLSLRAVLRFLKQTLRHPDIQISGDAIVDGDKLELRARVVDVAGDVHTLSQTGKPTEIEPALAALAEQVMDVVDPYVLGAYWLTLEGKSCQPKAACGYAKAIQQYQKIINTTVQDEAGGKRIAWAYVGWAHVHNLHGEQDQGMEKCELALRFDPDNASAHGCLGNALDNLDRSKEAIAQYRQAVELDPRNVYAYNNWGLALAHLGKHEEALLQYHKAEDLDPKLAMPYNNCGNALAHLGKHEEAILQYRKAVELDPKLAIAYNNWGNALADLGKHEEAVAQYRKALELDPKWTFAYNDLGPLLNRLNRPKEALDLARQAVQAGLKPGDLEDWPCVALQKLKDPAKPDAYQAEAARFGCH